MSDEQPPGLVQSKVDAKVFFLTPIPRARTLAGPFDAVVHLFEHRYDATTVFWYGAAEIGCTTDDYRRCVNEAKNEGPLWMRVELSDGRWGGAALLDSGLKDTFYGPDAGSFCKMTFVGNTGLTLKHGARV